MSRSDINFARIRRRARREEAGRAGLTGRARVAADERTRRETADREAAAQRERDRIAAMEPLPGQADEADRLLAELRADGVTDEAAEAPPELGDGQRRARRHVRRRGYSASARFGRHELGAPLDEHGTPVRTGPHRPNAERRRAEKLLARAERNPTAA